LGKYHFTDYRQLPLGISNISKEPQTMATKPPAQKLQKFGLKKFISIHNTWLYDSTVNTMKLAVATGADTEIVVRYF
jgi:hypothetical protein